MLFSFFMAFQVTSEFTVCGEHMLDSILLDVTV